MTETKGGGGGEENSDGTVHHAGDQSYEGKNSKPEEGFNRVDQEMREMATGGHHHQPGTVATVSNVSSVSSGSAAHPGLRSSLRNKNLDPKLKVLSSRAKGEVNVAFSSDP